MVGDDLAPGESVNGRKGRRGGVGTREWRAGRREGEGGYEVIEGATERSGFSRRGESRGERSDRGRRRRRRRRRGRRVTYGAFTKEWIPPIISRGLRP